MEIPSILFYVLSAIIVGATLYLLFSSDILRSLFAFALIVISLAGIYVLLQAELVAVIQLMIYAGGIVVIMVFGIMLTKEISEKGVRTQHHQIIPAVIIALAFLGLGFFMINASTLSWNYTELNENVVKKAGQLFLTDHIIAFELIAFLLLVVLVGASFIAQRSREGE